MRFWRSLVAAVVVATAAITPVMNPPAAFAGDNTAATVQAAVTNNAGLVAAVVPSTADVDSAAQTSYIDVPFDATKGVRLIRDALTTIFNLPNARYLDRGERMGDGRVVYHNSNGSDVVVSPAADGAQLLTVAENADAPTDYAYPLGASSNDTIGLTLEGGAQVFDSTGELVSAIAPPWARDARGSIIPTWFTTDGRTLTQHIAHKTPGVAYPVIADPDYTWYGAGVVISFNKWDTGIIGASSAFTPVWVAAATLSGEGGNRLYNAIWYIQVIAAWDGAIGQCLWIWLPRNGDISAGGYNC